MYLAESHYLNAHQAVGKLPYCSSSIVSREGYSIVMNLAGFSAIFPVALVSVASPRMETLSKFPNTFTSGYMVEKLDSQK